MRLYGILLIGLLLMGVAVKGQELGARWSESRAQQWYDSHDWFAGTNFNPSTAINQLEMWQAESFDLETIERELKWSADLGFNLHRVFLHNLVWQQNSGEYLERIDKFLEMADKYDIKIMFVLFDDVWDPLPVLGKQPDPFPHRHNSGWVQAPGREYLEDASKDPLLEAYVKGVLTRFKNDNRVVIWDLYNEPGNPNANSYGAISTNKTELSQKEKNKHALRLVSKTFKWARDIGPSQPITMGIWRGSVEDWNDISAWDTPEKLSELDRAIIINSDVITFHVYANTLMGVKRRVNKLKAYNRPIICTEYMARTNNNLFEDVMPYFKEENIGAINWGFVSGKTNTIYPWESWEKTFTKEPDIWFHDILRKDGTPFSEAEVKLIRSLTK
ncbi:cellulase family glycosylhydrolase [Maribacter sp. 2304DJ31-5]|uniref:cellulase family glycosylhydrolase n=1 Tax=Maribacter sp. 2304DJ31-5 TaxID=3386273 RepID=UPI0039BC99C3